MALESLPADAILRASVTNVPSQQLTLVHRDEGFPLIPPDPQNEIQSAGQAVLQTLGPFIDAGGRQVAVDVLASAAFIPVQRTGQPFPFLYVSSAQALPFTGIPNLVQWSLGAGTVWISAPLLSADVPPSTLVGVQISSGRLRWSGAPIFFLGPAPTSITVPAAASVSLSLVLVSQPSRPGMSPPAPEFSVQTPQNVTFDFTPTAASLATSDNAKLTVLGTSLTLSQIVAPATYASNLNRLRLAFKADKPQVTVVQSSAQLVEIAGSANITSASWTLPLTPAPSSPTDNTLPSASGVGGLSLDIQPSLAILASLYNSSINCGPCTLLGEESTFVISGQNAIGGRAAVTIPLWSSSQVAFRPQRPFTFRYINQFDGHESWTTVLPCMAKLDQPRPINNNRLIATSLNASLVFLRNGTTTSCTINAPGNPDDILTRSFAMRNLLLRTRIGRFVVRGNYTASGVTDGILGVQLTVVTALPFLPDPYTSNYGPLTGDPGLASATLDVLIKWQGRKLSSLDMSFVPRLSRNLPSGSATASQVSTLDETRSARIPTLLDLSTNVSQFGVSFLLNDAEQAPSVQDMYLQIPASSLAVTALPAVQWEPVITDPNPDLFQTPLTFQNSGPATVFVSNSVTLTPIAPRQAIDNLLSDYHANPPSAVTARFTLPFGLVANATLTRSLNFLVIPPSLNNIQPTFSDSKLQAGDQLSIGASRRLTFNPSSSQLTSASIPGTILSAKNAFYNGLTTTDTVLGVLQDIFTNDFTQNPRIPVTRVDLSGFGESMFSDWRDPTSLPPDISKVALDVLVGRTAKEVVQAFSILYPYGVAVVRTITIERENSATIVRHDSGWQAVSDGRYQFPVPAGTTPFVTHPGVVKGVVDVQNIRDLTPDQMYKIPVGAETIELMPVKFDCYADIENVVLGGTSKGVLALDQVGYVQITKATGASSLTSGQYAKLLQDNGPLGGLVDCVTDIGKSGLHMRILRIGAGPSRTDSSATDYELSMAAFGAPIFPKNGGQWSFVFQPGNSAPQNVDPQKGVPLIQQNAPNSTSPILPCRFADPSDLIATTPASLYSLIHSTTSYRLLFPQPKIEATAPRQISSMLPIYLADPFALSTLIGPFPQISSCILINDTNWKLNIAPDGNLHLQLSAPTYKAAAIGRVLHNNPNIRSIAYTNDEKGNASIVSLAIDTASTPSWSCNITNLSLAIETDTFSEISRIVGVIDSSSIQAAKFNDPRLVFGPKLSVVAALVSFLEYFAPTPPLDVGFGSVNASLVFNLQKFLSMPAANVTPVGKWFAQYVIDLDFKIAFVSTEADVNYEISTDLTFKIPLIPQGPSPIIVFLANTDFKFGDSGDTFALTIGAGYGYQLEVATFEAYAYAAMSFTLIVGNSILGFGLTLLIKADIDLEVVEATVTAEVRAEMLQISCDPHSPTDKSVWAVGQFTLAVEITLFAVLDIEFDYQTECTKNTDNGPCPLVDV